MKAELSYGCSDGTERVNVVVIAESTMGAGVRTGVGGEGRGWGGGLWQSVNCTS